MFTIKHYIPTINHPSSNLRERALKTALIESEKDIKEGNYYEDSAEDHLSRIFDD